MARVSTTNHALSKATDGSVDVYDFTLDHTNLLDRVDAALAGIGAYAGGAGFVNGNAGNAGKWLSASGSGSRGRVLGLASGDDASLIFQDNAGGTGADKCALGYDDSRDSFALSQGATLGANGAEITGAGNLNALQFLEVRGARLQSFILQITNNAGTIQHRIWGGLNNSDLTFAGKITGANASYANTPGVNSGTNFTNGVGYDAANTFNLHFNTAAQTLGGLWQTSISLNDTGTPLIVLPYAAGLNVGGVTLSRLLFALRNASSGAVYGWDAIPSGKTVYVRFFGFVE